MTKKEALEYIERAKGEIAKNRHRVFGYNGYDALCSAADALRAQMEAEKNELEADRSPCVLCGYGGKHLEAPPCCNCPAHPKKAEKNEPLTLDELRQMDGEPVYCPGEEMWGIVKVDKAGQWADMPFLVGRWRGVNCELDIGRRKLKCYRRKPKEAPQN